MAIAEGSSGIFGNGNERMFRNDPALVALMYLEIGLLKVKRDFLVERTGP